MTVQHRFLLNFAASYSGGGLKRLSEFAKWFDANGGAWFIIHPKCVALKDEFRNNRFWIAGESRFQRFFRDCQYLSAIEREIGIPLLYYSYGIPIYRPVGRTNWFHLSNVLPLVSDEVPLALPDRLKLRELGRRIRRNAHNADIISAESAYSLSLIDDAHRAKLVLSINGSDDELAHLQGLRSQPRENIATVVGTYGYKALEDSYRVFETLRQANEGLTLVIIGNDEYVPKQIRRKPEVVLKGVLRRRDVLKTLSTSRYYISTTRIENSANATSEGVVFAQESIVSDIAPHRELLAGTPFRLMNIPGVARPLLHVLGADMSAANLRSWQEVISDMISRVPTPG